MNISDLYKKYIKDQKRYWKNLRQQSKLHNLQRDLSGLYSEVRKEAKPIFVLSTGRTGTMLLTSLLEHSEHLMAVHEPSPELSYHSALAFAEPRGNQALQMAADVARYEIIRDAYLLNKRYVETNNRVTFFAYYLADLYPQAKFLHLVRHPKDFIKSGLARDWYSNESIFDEGRIKSEELFQDFTAEQKIAWLWAATNQFINDFAKEHQGRCFFLKGEDLFTKPAVVQESLSFLNIDDISLTRIEDLTTKKQNPTRNMYNQMLVRDYKEVPEFLELVKYYGYKV